MSWLDLCRMHPDAWVIAEVVEAHAEPGTELRHLAHIAILEHCADAETTYRRHRELRRADPARELCFFHTGWQPLDFVERWQLVPMLATIVESPFTSSCEPLRA